jgi:iron-sulfur cluster repair protein YtfE (RIC family)
MTAPSIIDLLKKDHREVAKLFDQAKDSTARAVAKRTALWAQITAALEAHMAFEEAHVYPLLEGDSAHRPEALEARAEHDQAKRIIAENGKLTASDERWLANVTVLAEDITHHVHEEEAIGGLFAHIRKMVAADKLAELGEAYLAMKEQATAAHAER